MTLEHWVLIGVMGNFVLQSLWFIWTLRNHSHKHIENNPEELEDYSELEEELQKNIQDLYKVEPQEPVEWVDVRPDKEYREQIFNKERKYNPDEIKGKFDVFFAGEDNE